MSRLLLLAALPLSLIVPGGAIAIAAFSTSPERETIEVPVSPEPASPNPSPTSPLPTPSPEPETQTVQLFGGRSIRIDSSCADERRIDEQKQHAIAAANRIPALKQKLLNRERDVEVSERRLQRFLDQHPEGALARDDFARYEALKADYEARHQSYGAALTAHNRQVGRFNRLADAYNADLRACAA